MKKVSNPLGHPEREISMYTTRNTFAIPSPIVLLYACFDGAHMTDMMCYFRQPAAFPQPFLFK